MTKMLMRAGLTVFLACLITSCGIAAPPDGPVRTTQPQDCSGGTFDFGTSGGAQPLGSSDLMLQKMLEARANKQTIAMQDLAHSAGWSDEWDRMVEVGEHTERDELNSRAQTTGYCWKNLPPTSPMSDRPSDTYYLFVRNNRPVQFIQVRPSENPIILLRGVVLTKETVLRYYGSRLKPE
ncbi:hypothetical protein AB0L82_01570 [Nocardia sp. NPDC052001]|uniref:hypothetical protein n=1 Tax=Nocardia sp. NPDC052001 TaxID=3154853 RepID=UPI0034468493